MIEIIDHEELCEWKIAGSDGAKLLYRPVPDSVLKQATKRHTKKGITDFIDVGEDLLQYSIQGWEGFGSKGKKIDFTPDHIEAIPRHIRNDFLEELLLETEEVELAAKNSKKSSGGS